MAKYVNVLPEGDLEITESNSDLHSLGPFGFAAFFLYVPLWTSSAIPSRVKKPAATSKPPRIWKKLASSCGKIEFAAPLAMSNLAKPGFLHSTSPSAGRLRGARHTRNSTYAAPLSGGVNNDSAPVVLSDYNYSDGEAFS